MHRQEPAVSMHRQIQLFRPAMTISHMVMKKRQMLSVFTSDRPILDYFKMSTSMIKGVGLCPIIVVPLAPNAVFLKIEIYFKV